MSSSAPSARFDTPVPAVAAASDDTTIVGGAPFDGTVAAVSYIAEAAITGVTANSRTVRLVNKGQAGAGTTMIASKAFITGTNAVAADETALVLTATAADLVVVAGDVLAWESAHVGVSGLADPGGLVAVTMQRAYA